jgi:murein L,D-transpeptidase YafK
MPKKALPCFIFKPIQILLSFFLILILFAFWIPPTRANPELKDLVPAALVRVPKNGPEHIILVDKSLQKLFLYKKDNLFQPFKTYTCSTGENEGPKEKQNDRKTPEGIYFFVDSMKKRELAPIYGAMAFPIDYPNSFDKLEGRNGYGIWFHGTNKILKPHDTNGCVALEDQDIQDLANYITLFKTPAIIGSQIEMVSVQNLQKDQEELEALIEDWRAAWQNKDIEKYGSFYSARFFTGPADQQEWKEYKSRLTKQYDYIHVAIDNLQLFKNNGRVLAVFDQHFKTPTFETFGQKKLFLQKNSAQWKIFAEQFQGLKPAQTVTAPPPPTPPQPSTAFEEIENIVYAWMAVWQSKDLDAYLAFYDQGFHSRDMDLRAWRQHRQRLNQKYTNIQIEISNLQTSLLAEDKALVTFTQQYRADDYMDQGLKKLLLIKKRKEWKIKEEDWSPL